MVNSLTEKNLDKIRCITEVQVIINFHVILNTVRTTDYTIMVKLVFAIIEKSVQALLPLVLHNFCCHTLPPSEQYNSKPLAYKLGLANFLANYIS